MAGVTGGKLAAEVTLAGGFGLVGVGKYISTFGIIIS